MILGTITDAARGYSIQVSVRDDEESTSHYTVNLFAPGESYGSEWNGLLAMTSLPPVRCDGTGMIPREEPTPEFDEFTGITTAPSDPRHAKQVIDHIAHLDDVQLAAIRVTLNGWAEARGI